MRRLVLAPLVIAIACVLATPAQAHWYDDQWNCNAIPMPCEGNLSNAEAVKFEQIEYRRHHSWTNGWEGAYHRINASATWVFDWNGNPYSSDQCLVDIDRIPGTSLYVYNINCEYWGNGPKP